MTLQELDDAKKLVQEIEKCQSYLDDVKRTIEHHEKSIQDYVFIDVYDQKRHQTTHLRIKRKEYIAGMKYIASCDEERLEKLKKEFAKF